MSSDHDVLGVSSDADLTTVKTAYRRRARTCHPDRGGDAEEFQAVREAYERLVAGEPAPEERPKVYPDPPDRPTHDEPDWGADATAEPTWGTDVPTYADGPGRRQDDPPEPGPLSERHPLPPDEPVAPPHRSRASRTEIVLRSAGMGLTSLVAVLAWFSGGAGSAWWYIVPVVCALPGRFWARWRWGVLVTITALMTLGGVIAVWRPGQPVGEALIVLGVVAVLGALVVSAWLARRRHRQYPAALRDHQAGEALRTDQRHRAERWDWLDHVLATDPNVSLWFVAEARPANGSTVALLNRVLPDGSHQRCTQTLWGRAAPGTWIVADLAAGQVVAAAHETDRQAWNAVQGW